MQKEPNRQLIEIGEFYANLIRTEEHSPAKIIDAFFTNDKDYFESNFWRF
jgi:myosin-crossreactive antigen